jgi:hypothetical protein
MFSRILFILIALLWVTMNVLLWRAEYGSQKSTGSPVPVETVWQKVLNAPDESPLNIVRRGKRAGFCRVQTSVAEALSKLDEAPKSGVKVKSRIRFDGGLTFDETFRRLRFQGELSLSANQDWEELRVRLVRRPIVFEVHSLAAEQTVHVTATDGEGRFEHAFKFSEFQNPMGLLGGFMGSLIDEPFNELELPVVGGQSGALPSAVKWEARNDTLVIGHTPVHVYRIESKLTDHYKAAVLVSRAGEILKVELPDGILLLHDKLFNQ